MMEMQEDLLAGGKFTRKALLSFESDRPQVGPLLALTLGTAAAGAIGLLYNLSGQIALMTTSGTRPGMDTAQDVLVQALSIVLGGLGFKALADGRREMLKRFDSEYAFVTLNYSCTDGYSPSGKLLDLKRQKRIVIIFGSGEGLADALRSASAYRRRWLSSDTLVVAVGDPPAGVAGRWLAKAEKPEVWKRCFNNFQATTRPKDQTNTSEDEAASWLLLGKSGRIRGTGPAGQSWDEVLGFVGVQEDLAILSPRSDTIKSQGEASLHEVLAVHDSFYAALKEGDAAAMEPLWADAADLGLAPPQELPGSTRVPWASVLSDKAELLDVVDVDVVYQGKDSEEALVTSIEVVPGEGGLLNAGGPGGKGTLLATKRIARDKGGNWKILSHQTIPYCSNTLANQSLRCTSKGCILLKPK
jgi:hypothetical protein